MAPEAGQEGAVNAKALGLIVIGSLSFVPPAIAQVPNMRTITTAKMETDPAHNLVGVSCQIKGSRRRYLCVIDSGATNTVVSDQVIKAEGVMTYMDTTNGIVRVPKREVSLIIGDGPELKAQAFVPSKMPEGIQILIGQDVLRQFCSVLFDYNTGEIEFRR
jgi:hypothetical protein